MIEVNLFRGSCTCMKFVGFSHLHSIFSISLHNTLFSNVLLVVFASFFTHDFRVLRDYLINATQLHWNQENIGWYSLNWNSRNFRFTKTVLITLLHFLTVSFESSVGWKLSNVMSCNIYYSKDTERRLSRFAQT